MQFKTLLLGALALPFTLASPVEYLKRKKSPKQVPTPACAIHCFAKLQAQHAMDCPLDEPMGACLCHRSRGVSFVKICCGWSENTTASDRTAADVWITDKCSPYRDWETEMKEMPVEDKPKVEDGH